MVRPFTPRGAMPPVSAFEAMSRDEAAAWMHRLGLPRIAGGEETDDEKKAREAREADERKAREAEEAELEKLGEAGKKALIAERQAKRDAEAKAAQEREAREKAERERKEAQDKLDKIERDKRKAEEDELAKKGEFEKLAQEREAEAAKEKERADRLEQEVKDLKARLQTIDDDTRKAIEDGVKDLPDDLKAFDPGKDAPLADRKRWYDIAVKTAADRDDSTNRNGGGNGPRPPRKQTKNDRTPEQEAQIRARYE